MKIALSLLLFGLLLLFASNADASQDALSGVPVAEEDDTEAQEIKEQQLLLHSEEFDAHDHLDDLNPNDADIRNLQASTSFCSDVVLDFETAGDGTDLSNGAYVKNEWRDAYGLRVFAPPMEFPGPAKAKALQRQLVSAATALLSMIKSIISPPSCPRASTRTMA